MYDASEISAVAIQLFWGDLWLVHTCIGTLPFALALSFDSSYANPKAITNGVIMEALIALRFVSHWDKNDIEVVMWKSLVTRVCKISCKCVFAWGLCVCKCVCEGTVREMTNG